MDVEPEPVGEQLLGDEHAVVGDDHDARLARELGEPVRLLHREPVGERDLLGGRRQLLAPAALRSCPAS